MGGSSWTPAQAAGSGWPLAWSPPGPRAPKVAALTGPAAAQGASAGSCGLPRPPGPAQPLHPMNPVPKALIPTQPCRLHGTHSPFPSETSS